MPFNHPFPRSFTAQSIQTHAPVSSGVYGISNSGEWIFVGETDNIQQSLLQHLSGIDGVLGRRPTGFVFEACDRSARPVRFGQLTSEYKPSCNRQEAYR